MGHRHIVSIYKWKLWGREDDDDSGLMDIFTCSNPDRGSDIDRDMDSGRVVSNALKAAGNGGGGG